MAGRFHHLVGFWKYTAQDVGVCEYSHNMPYFFSQLAAVAVAAHTVCSGAAAQVRAGLFFFCVYVCIYLINAPIY